jgi:hypothetical protein
MSAIPLAPFEAATTSATMPTAYKYERHGVDKAATIQLCYEIKNRCGRVISWAAEHQLITGSICCLLQYR